MHDASKMGHPSIFKWETLKEIGPCVLRYNPAVPGATFEVQLTSGRTVRVWRAADGKQFFCHGLTFRGVEAPGGPISPFTGQPVETILEYHCEAIPEREARSGDILVWRGLAPETTPHSAILTDPVWAPGKSYLDDTSRLRSKNGMLPEMDVSLADLFREYGEAYNVYRWR